MATVYKVELEVVSDWVDLSTEEIKEMIETKIEKGNDSVGNPHKLRTDDIKVIRK